MHLLLWIFFLPTPNYTINNIKTFFQTKTQQRIFKLNKELLMRYKNEACNDISEFKIANNVNTDLIYRCSIIVVWKGTVCIFSNNKTIT